MHCHINLTYFSSITQGYIQFEFHMQSNSKDDKHDYRDQAQRLIKTHQKQAEQSFQNFRDTLLADLQKDLKSIDIQLKKQLSNVCRKLQNKIRNNYSVGSLNSNIMRFFLQPYVSQQYENVLKSIQKLKSKIFEYIHDFTTNILQKNIQKFKDVSLFYFQNRIKHVHQEWYSVTSRSPLQKAEIIVSGLRRPETSWLVLGVCKKPKEYSPIRKTINHQQFLGNIYLNGSDMLQGGAHKTKKDLMENDVFVIENVNRMIYVYKKKQGRNMDEAFILDDNTDYYFYVAMKGPIFIDFRGE